MIEVLSSWAKGLGLAIVVVSIIEMLLPNNKTKKYIRMVMGIYIIFNIISPIVKNKEILNIDNIDIEKYATTQISSEVNQTSMNERIEELYIQEIEKDITKKLEEQGYELESCKVNAQISDNENDTKITKIKINVKKTVQLQNNNQDENIENKVVTEIQKIKPIDTQLKKDDENNKIQETIKVTKSDIQNIKKFLIEEYGVNEKCLEIN